MNAWTVILDIVLILISIVLIIAVLLQQGLEHGEIDDHQHTQIRKEGTAADAPKQEAEQHQKDHSVQQEHAEKGKERGKGCLVSIMGV